jgi:prophage antirepressor-like protein
MVTLSNTERKFGPYGQSFNLINESGLYALVFRSRKPEAKAFRKWVTDVVLPAIRENGLDLLPGTRSATMWTCVS